MMMMGATLEGTDASLACEHGHDANWIIRSEALVETACRVHRSYS